MLVANIVVTIECEDETCEEIARILKRHRSELAEKLRPIILDFVKAKLAERVTAKN